MRKYFGLPLCLTVIVVLLPFFVPGRSWAGPGFRLDGRFEDWEGRAFLSDRQGDARREEDLKSVFWGTNENDHRLYFMVERHDPADAGSVLTCRIYFDINGNGGYEDGTDSFAELNYRPGNAGEVEVTLYSASGRLLATYGGNWGEVSGEGGRRFEFFIPMGELKIFPAQPVRFYLAGAGGGDRLPDRGDNQWRPFPLEVKDTAMLVAASVFWLAGAVFLRRHRIWIFYYVWGAVGFTFLLILFLRGSLVEYQMERLTGAILHRLLSCLDIMTFIYDRAPGTILVLIDLENSWTTVDIDIESSGLLEACIFLGLLLFYPPYRPAVKVLFSLAGLISIYAVNILRLMLIITVIHRGGRDMIFIAHTILGRLFFFVLIVVIYWYVFTRPSLLRARRKVENA